MLNTFEYELGAHALSLLSFTKPRRDDFWDALEANETCQHSMGLGYEGDYCNGYYDKAPHVGCCPRNPRNSNPIEICFSAWQRSRDVGQFIAPAMRAQWARVSMHGVFINFAEQALERILQAAGRIP